MSNLTLPGNPRYQPKNLQDIWGYDVLYLPVGQVELASLRVLAEIGVIPKSDIDKLTPLTEQNILEILTTAVDETERKHTKHDIRAWVRLAQNKCTPELGRWLHLVLTSYDPLDTARALQFMRAHQLVLAPALERLIGIFSQLVTKYAGTVQIGRTHGQHALPITVGFWLATILSRILYNAKKVDEYAAGLVGKISGAVGAYNAQVGLGIAEKCGEVSFEERVLAKLGLKPAPISTQILPPEPLAYFLFSCVMLSAALAQLGRDCRHLMRTEIAEIGEPFEQGQVGSSTMAHKRNPINFENLEGMYIRTKNEFGKVLDTLISEHQRDLVASSVYRDFPIMVVNLVQQLNTLLRQNDQGITFLERLSVDQSNLKRNFTMSAHVILAEPLYIAIQMAGYKGDAHKLINERAVSLAQQTGGKLVDVVKHIAESDAELWSALRNIPDEVIELMYHPENYIGLAQVKAEGVIRQANNYLSDKQIIGG